MRILRKFGGQPERASARKLESLNLFGVLVTVLSPAAMKHPGQYDRWLSSGLRGGRRVTCLRLVPVEIGPDPADQPGGICGGAARCPGIGGDGELLADGSPSRWRWSAASWATHLPTAYRTGGPVRYGGDLRQ